MIPSGIYGIMTISTLNVALPVLVLSFGNYMSLLQIWFHADTISTLSDILQYAYEEVMVLAENNNSQSHGHFFHLDSVKSFSHTHPQLQSKPTMATTGTTGF